MGVRVGLLFLVVLGISWTCADARTLIISDPSVMQISYEEPKSKIQATTIAATDERVCLLCEQFTAQAVEYLSDNKTQKQVIEGLHLACHKLHSLKQKLDIIEMLLKACDAVENHVKECKKMVFEYGPLFMDNAEQFLEMTDVCAVLHACKTSVTGVEASSHVEISILSES